MSVAATSTAADAVAFYLDGELQSTDSNAPYTWNWDTTKAPNGNHTLIAKAYSGSTILGSSQPRTVQVSNGIVHDTDEFEPNNSSLQSTQIALGSSINGRISNSSDADWFKITVTTPGILSVGLTVPAGKDYDWEMYGPNASWVAGSYNDAGVSESMVYRATVSGTYWLRIYGYPIGHSAYSTTASYSLTAGINPGTILVDSQPTNVSVPYGAAATFYAHAVINTGSALSYQWYRNGSAIAGAIGSTYTTISTQFANNEDQYTVRVTSEFGSTTSQSATVNVTGGTTIVWTGAVSNNWDEPLNWDLERVPNSSDVVRVNSGTTISLSGNATGIIIVNGTINWTGGSINASGLTLAPGSVLNINGVANKILYGALNNAGTVNWNGGNIQLGSAVISNLSGGTFNALTSASMYHQYGNAPIFTNAGSFRKGGDSSTAVLSGVAFTNTGFVDLQSGSLYVGGSFNNDGSVTNHSGTLTMPGGGNCNGVFDASAGAVNLFSGGGFSFGTSVSFVGAGANRINGAGINLNGEYGFHDLEMLSGSIGGSFTLNGSLKWNGGTLSGPAAIGAGGLLDINGADSKILAGVFSNSGTVNWNGGNIQLSSAVISNLNGGTFNVLTSASMYHQYGNVPSFANSGTFRKSVDSGSAGLSGVIFINTGFVDGQSGTLYFNGGGGISNGTFQSGTGAFIDYSGVSFSDGVNFIGSGANRIVGGVNMSGSVASQNMELAGGTLNGSAEIHGTIKWTSGTFGPGPFTIASGAALNINGATNKLLYGELNNAGTINWNEGNIQLGSAVISNLASGTFNVLASVSMYHQYGNAPIFTNLGILDLQAGTAAFSGFNPNFETGSILKGSGHFSGTFNVTGNTTFQNFEITDGNTLTGSGAIGGSFNWTGGTISASGLTLAPGAVLNINGAANKLLYGTLNNSGTINWNEGNIQLGSAVISNLVDGTFNALASASMYHQYGNAPIITNAGSFRKGGDSGTASLSGVAFTNTGLVDLQGGSLNVGGNFTQSTGGMINFGIRGTTTGFHFGKLIASGQLVMNGGLNVTFLDGFQTSAGESFRVIEYGSRVGNFTGITTVNLNRDFTLKSNTDSTSMTLTTTLTGLAQWKIDRYGSDAGNPAIAGDGADPDGSGIPNLLRYAFNTEVPGGGRSRLPIGTTEPDALDHEIHLTLSYSRRIENTELNYTVEITDNMATWDGTEAQLEQVGSPTSNADGVTELVKVRVKAQLSDSDRKFLRVNVTHK